MHTSHGSEVLTAATACNLGNPKTTFYIQWVQYSNLLLILSFHSVHNTSKKNLVSEFSALLSKETYGKLSEFPSLSGKCTWILSYTAHFLIQKILLFFLLCGWLMHSYILVLQLMVVNCCMSRECIKLCGNFGLWMATEKWSICVGTELYCYYYFLLFLVIRMCRAELYYFL